MKQDIWIPRTFYDKGIPNWPCPICNSGILHLAENKLFSEETQGSIRMREYCPMPCYHMTALLKCNKCHEYVSMIGSGDEAYLQDNNNGDHIFAQYKPKYFYPALRLFTIPKKCPKDVSELIIDSFALYWSDLPACIGRIRVAIEKLMDHYKINETVSVNGKISKRPLTLDKRIQQFKIKISDEIGDLLLALKWIGNEGAHDGVKLNEKIVFETYETLKLALDKLYDPKESEIKHRAKAIIKKKGI